MLKHTKRISAAINIENTMNSMTAKVRAVRFNDKTVGQLFHKNSSMTHNTYYVN